MTFYWLKITEMATPNSNSDPDPSTAECTTPGCTAGSLQCVYTRKKRYCLRYFWMRASNCCMVQIVANVCLHKNNERLSYNELVTNGFSGRINHSFRVRCCN